MAEGLARIRGICELRSAAAVGTVVLGICGDGDGMFKSMTVKTGCSGSIFGELVVDSLLLAVKRVMAEGEVGWVWGRVKLRCPA
jgi:hypothetical protein